MADTLLPCPFCGRLPYFEEAQRDYALPARVACENLDCAAAPYLTEDTDAAAIAAWNRRTKEEE